MFRTKHLKLTKEQQGRGVIYSSCLRVTNHPEIESITHEVLDSDPEKWHKIANLEDVSFFKNMAKDFGYNVINEVRR